MQIILDLVFFAAVVALLSYAHAAQSDADRVGRVRPFVDSGAGADVRAGNGIRTRFWLGPRLRPWVRARLRADVRHGPAQRRSLDDPARGGPERCRHLVCDAQGR